MATRIQHRRDTASNWTSLNPTPFSGELCLETDTRKLKMGDGATAWVSLNYVSSPGSSSGSQTFPFFKGDGTSSSITVTSGQFPFLKADGSQDNIGV